MLSNLSCRYVLNVLLGFWFLRCEHFATHEMLLQLLQKGETTRFVDKFSRFTRKHKALAIFLVHNRSETCKNSNKIYKSSFQYKYFNNPKLNEPSPTDLTRPDGNLELNIGKIKIVFLYRFITELLVSILLRRTCFCHRDILILSDNPDFQTVR